RRATAPDALSTPTGPAMVRRVRPSGGEAETMAVRYGNIWGRCAASLTALANRRAAQFRWGTLAILAVGVLWAADGGWVATDSPSARVAPSDALYRTIGALTFQDDYGAAPNFELSVARWVGMLVPFVGLLFAFSSQLGQSVARLFSAFAAHHVVIAGGS